jgi:hypothetical protein
MSVGLNKLELKSNKEHREWLIKQEKSGRSQDQIDEVIEERIAEGLKILNMKFSQEPVNRYSELEIEKDVNSKVNDIKVDNDQLSTLLRLVKSEKLIYYKADKLRYEENSNKLSFGLTHEYFEIAQFRDKPVPHYTTVYVSVTIEVNSPYALVFITGRQDLFGKIRKLLKELIGAEFNIVNLTWDNEALKAIVKQYAKEIEGINARNIEGKITEIARATDLRQTLALTQLYKGEVYMVKFILRNVYPGNSISINGRWGLVTSDQLTEEDIQDFIKVHLLTYSSRI